ncbi:hypothetical protein [Pelagovum sp. HNIBRBA483]|uniref:hypothetical protein n=1 Tax=Pelagovum sp. HNIBRBA483 TaxID=3233341 RepID=UPI0034A2DF58
MKLAVIYHYYEKDEIYKDNLVFFLSAALHEDVHYFIYISGTCSANLPKRPNLHYKKIENKNNDFGGVVAFFNDPRSKGYDAYIFVNSSMRGPFLPTYHQDRWYAPYTARLTDKVALVGSSINHLPSDAPHSALFAQDYGITPPFTHVQTTAYALSGKGARYLYDKGFFSEPQHLGKHDVVSRYEILLSQLLLQGGFEIAALLPTYTRFSGTNAEPPYLGTLEDGDPLFANAFYGRTLSPLESLFVKTNRNMIAERELASYTFTALASKEPESLTPDGAKLRDLSHRKAIAKPPNPIISAIRQELATLRKRARKLRKRLRLAK